MKSMFIVFVLCVSSFAAETPFPYFQCHVRTDGKLSIVVLREGENNGPISFSAGDAYRVRVQAYEYQVFLKVVETQENQTLFNGAMSAGPIPFEGRPVYQSNFSLNPAVVPGLKNPVYIRCRGLDEDPTVE